MKEYLIKARKSNEEYVCWTIAKDVFEAVENFEISLKKRGMKRKHWSIFDIKII